MLIIPYFCVFAAGGEIQVIGRLGETVTLQCPLNSPAKISWMFDDNGEKILLAEFRDQKFIRVNGNYFSRRLEGSNSGTALRIKHLRMEDGGVFTAHITVNGSATDISYVLTVLAGGEIQVIGRLGETVTLQCPLNSPAKISWMFDNNGEKILLAEYRDQKFIRVNNNYFINRLEGSNSGTALRIKHLRMEDGGVFTAHITVNGSATEIIYVLTVLGRGDIILPVTGLVGGNVTLPTYLTLPAAIERISWMFHDKGKRIHLAEFRHQKFITVNKKYFLNRLEKPNDGTALRIRELRMEDSGIFTAHIHFNGRKRDISYILAVFAGGDIQVIGRVGETVTLQCPLNLPTRILWTYDDNGEKILLAEYRDQKFIRVNNNYFINRLEGSNSGTALLIRELKREDSGVFTAHITVNGSATDISYILNVLGRGDIILPVTGLVGGNVTLPTYLTLPAAIERISLMFHDKGKKIHLAELRNHKFSRLNKDYFYNRLEKSNDGTALQIRELRMEDSGIFTAHIHVNGQKRDISYILAVFEPIPTPVIEVTSDENFPDLCHLHCSVPSNSPTLSYSWTYRDTGTDRLYANGSTITVSLKDKALGAEFTCWVQNPAHRNSVSVVLKSYSGRQTGIQPKIRPEIQQKIQTETQPEIKTEIRPGIKTEIQPEIKTEIQPGIKTEKQPGILTEIRPGIKTEMRPGIYEKRYKLRYDKEYKERYSRRYKLRYDQGYKERYSRRYKLRYEQGYKERYKLRYDQGYKERYSRRYKERYSRRYKRRYKQRYDKGYKERYSRRYKRRYKQRYDKGYRERYSRRYKQRYDQGYRERYSQRYKQRYKLRYDQGYRERYSRRYKLRYDQGYRERYSQRYKLRYDQGYKKRYSRRYKQRYKLRYDQGYKKRHDERYIKR
ncbi:hypothetical protein XENTR_v10022427 [Xenopus tropicalis]|nr:hypothetical protein XENTR_v10022427 [Xenopus tropicalis]